MELSTLYRFAKPEDFRQARRQGVEQALAAGALGRDKCRSVAIAWAAQPLLPYDVKVGGARVAYQGAGLDLKAGLQALAGSPVFSEVPREGLEQVLASAHAVAFEPGASVLTEGKMGDCAYVIVNGRAAVSQSGRHVRDLGAGDVFGELSLIDGGRRSASVVAITELSCLELSGSSLWKILHERPPVTEQLLRLMAGRLRDAERPLDRLTGLPNRAMFEELLHMSLERTEHDGGAVSILCVNLDGFRLINDALGPAGGDRILQDVADRLRYAAADKGVIARPGSDEFLILLVHPDDPGKAHMEAEAMITRISDALADSFHIDGREVFVTASVGVGVFPECTADGGNLIRDAVAAMHDSKRAGPGGHCVSTIFSDDASGKLELATKLRKAIKEKPWVMHYQPVVDLETRTLVGVEALIRWTDPILGPVSPALFIPMAEEMGLITQISEWVIEELCHRSAEWLAAGVNLRISFNLSPRELWRSGLVENVVRLLAAEGVPTYKLVVEITETSALVDPERTQEVLMAFHTQGIRLSIDDFGTGYSSLSRLKDMPISTLKIDRAFVKDLPGSIEEGRVTTAVIQLAENLGLTSLAEGIETEEQLTFLRDNGCRLGQGFLFSPAVPPDEIVVFYRGGPFAAKA